MAKPKLANVGISINTEWIELVQLSRDGRTIKSRKTPMPMAVLDTNGDRVKDPHTLAMAIMGMIAELNARPAVKNIHLSVPGTLVRIVEMPKINKSELVLALTSEAERYAVFNDTEALVDYEVISEEPDEKQKIILVALRKDTVAAYKETFEIAKLKLTSLEVETISSLRGLKYTGNLEYILSEVGDQPWGTIHFEPERVRISVWHYDQIKNWREVLLDTSDLRVMGEDAPIIQDLVEEVRRTIGMTRPLLWLTYGIPESLSTSLTSRFGATVRPMLPGDRLNLDDPKLSLASIGVACKSYDAFPAFIDIQPSADMQSSSGVAASFKMMMLTALVLGGIVAFIIGGLMIANFVVNMSLEGANKKNTEQVQQIGTLSTELATLQKQKTLSSQFAEKIIRIVNKNKAYAQVVTAIKERIPANVQLNVIVVDEGSVVIEGLSLDYPSIMLFSKNFDNTSQAAAGESPINDIALESINESVENGRRTYKFKMVGHPKIDQQP